MDGNRPPFSPASPEANAPFASSIIGNNGLSLVKPGLIVLPGTTTLARTREAAPHRQALAQKLTRFSRRGRFFSR